MERERTTEGASEQIVTSKDATCRFYLREIERNGKMGRKTPELEEEIKTTTREIISAFAKAPAPEKDFVTFRGTNDLD